MSDTRKFGKAAAGAGVWPVPESLRGLGRWCLRGLAAHWDAELGGAIGRRCALMFTVRWPSGSMCWLSAIAPKASRWSELPDEEIEIDMEYDEDRHTYWRKPFAIPMRLLNECEKPRSEWPRRLAALRQWNVMSRRDSMTLTGSLPSCNDAVTCSDGSGVDGQNRRRSAR